MSPTQSIFPNHITLPTGQKRARPAEVGPLALVFEKSVTEQKHKAQYT